MDRQLSNAAKQAVFAQSTDEVFIVLVTIDHENFTQPIRVASDPKQILTDAGVRGVESRGDEYLYVPFTINLPIQDDTNVARASLSVDNVSREIVKAVRSASSALSIKIEIVLSSDVDNPEVTIEDFKLESVTYDAFTISGDLSIDSYDLEPFPSRRFTPSDFPGLF